MHSIFTRHSWPVGHISRTITIVLAVNLGLRGALNGEAYSTTKTGMFIPQSAVYFSFMMSFD